MKLKYWTGFSKRKNSTKIPTATGTEIDVYWKEDTSIDSPSVVLSSNTFNIDYCYINDWGKYYFVSAIQTLTDGTVQYDLVEDALATNKTAIGSTVAHIAYSSTGYDKYLIDNRLPLKDTYSTDHDAKASGLSNTGCYILAAITDTTNGTQGAAGFYHITTSYLHNLMVNLFDCSVQAIVDKAFYDPFNSIIRCFWIPLDDATVDANCGSNDLITLNVNSPLSTSSMPVYGKQVTDNLVTLAAVSIPIPNRYQDFRDSQPYTSLSLYLPGIGLTDLNANDFSNSTNVNIFTRVDITTGDIIYWIYTDSGDVVKTVSFNGGVDVPLAHVAGNSGGALSAIGGAITTGATFLLTGNTTALTLGALATTSNAITAFNQRSTSLKGNVQGRSAFEDVTFSLLCTQIDTTDPDDASYIATWGRPVGVTHAINNHSGYVQCDNASVNIPGDNWERDEINSYLNNGFYYE